MILKMSHKKDLLRGLSVIPCFWLGFRFRGFREFRI